MLVVECPRNWMAWSFVTLQKPVGDVLSREKIRKIFRYAFIGLPLAGVVVADFLPLTTRAQQFLIMIVLIWMQVFFIFEVFFPGK